MTRQRMRKSLESASTTNCPYCKGKGMVRSKETVAAEALQKLSQHLRSAKNEHVELTACPEVVDVLSRDNNRAVKQLESQTHNRVSLSADPHIHVEETRIKRILDRRKKLW